ncbi:hypothetical protein F1904_11935 [Akkermansia muciniphila]|uniref:hypothetical protein n=1 Tax=Akkermansia muciniphila TaxID=239935 RepID=UPI00122EF069|nr:hypothetical protein [Akkermansia muciniphila]KAA3383956.1 hypothetical protein F1912_12895 [Akkermansia muciniphila]KAA3404640.1 hypothetical protein F1904_11935 [Akkermansia muciniphila]
MWNGKWTKELEGLYDEYAAMWDGMEPDEYEEILYDVMTYEEFVGYIKECLEKHLEIWDVVE